MLSKKQESFRQFRGILESFRQINESPNTSRILWVVDRHVGRLGRGINRFGTPTKKTISKILKIAWTEIKCFTIFSIFSDKEEQSPKDEQGSSRSSAG